MSKGGRTDAEFAAIYREHYARVVRLACALTGDAESARDVAQEVFIAVLRGLPAFRGDSALGTWIYRITLRTAGRHIARRPITSRVGFDADAMIGSASAESDVAMAEVMRAIGSLSLEARTVLSLVVIEGLSHDAVGDLLGIPVGTVGSRLNSARRALGECLEGSG